MTPARAQPPTEPVGRRRSAARRLTLSPIGFDVALALSQSPAGLRLAELAHVIGSPVSSVQTALRSLLASALVERLPGDPPRYVLSAKHPASNELASLATVLPEPERALAIMVRANQAVSYAGVDASGFIVAVDHRLTAAVEALDRHLHLVATARPEAPNVLRMDEDELRRMVRVALELRARVRDAVALRGTIGAVGLSAPPEPVRLAT